MQIFRPDSGIIPLSLLLNSKYSGHDRLCRSLLQSLWAPPHWDCGLERRNAFKVDRCSLSSEATAQGSSMNAF